MGEVEQMVKDLNYQLGLNGRLIMMTAVLGWARRNQEKLVETGLLKSLLAAMQECLQLHEVSQQAEDVMAKMKEGA